MITFSIICQNEELINKVQQTLYHVLGDEIEYSTIGNRELIENHLFYEIPQFVLFDLDDPELEAITLIKKILENPLLFNIRILGIFRDTENPPMIPGIFSILTPAEISTLLPNIVRILSSNQQLALQSGLISKLQQQGTLIIKNDPLLLEGYAEVVSNFLYSQNLISMQTKYGLKFSLVEMLINAVEHGNCGIAYEEKTKWLASGKDIIQLIQQKCKDPKIQAKRITLKYDISEKESNLSIRDEGEGFDILKIPEPNDLSVLMELHGRGIFMSRNFVKDLRYNEKGNEVTVTVEHLKNANRTIPEGFSKSQILDFEQGDIVFKENDKSNTLYYIVGGEFEVLMKNGRVVTTLNSTNIFLGEMAFLLGNRRTATVRAKTAGRLVKVNSQEWMDAVREYPYYGIFLSRLLAKKLDEQTPH